MGICEERRSAGYGDYEVVAWCACGGIEATEEETADGADDTSLTWNAVNLDSGLVDGERF